MEPPLLDPQHRAASCPIVVWCLRSAAASDKIVLADLAAHGPTSDCQRGLQLVERCEQLLALCAEVLERGLGLRALLLGLLEQRMHLLVLDMRDALACLVEQPIDAAHVLIPLLGHPTVAHARYVLSYQRPLDHRRIDADAWIGLLYW